MSEKSINAKEEKMTAENTSKDALMLEEAETKTGITLTFGLPV